MKIGIDARFLTHPQPGGFKTYTENLVSALASLDKENEYYLYLDRTPAANDIIPVQSNFQVRVITGSLPMLGVPWREQIRLSRQAAADQLDLFHSPCLTAPLFLSCPLVITVHDMIWAFPERFSQKGAWSFKRKFMEWYNYLVPKLATKRASAILTVSHAAKESIIEYLKYPASRIHVTLEAAHRSFVRIDNMHCLDEIRLKHDLPSKFILAIGSADPRKNIRTLVQAYSLLPRELQEEYQLAIVWTHTLLADELSQQIQGLGLESKIQFLKNITNEDLVYIYNSASLFVFPSLYEGFGLPLLEAMACGVPVAAADNSSIPEIVGDAAQLFDAKDVNRMSAVINRILSVDSLRMALIKKGIERSASFSWEKCARATIAVYGSTISKR